MLLLFFIMTSKLIIADGRVFCQDSFATPWKPLGYACPISCNVVVTAVNRLKIYDYHIMLKQRITENINISDIELKTISKHLEGNALITRKSNRYEMLNKPITIAYQRLLKNEDFVKDLKSELHKMAGDLKNGTCHKMAAGEPFKNNMRCARRLYNSQDFLRRITNVLNKYSDTKYKFNEEITEVLLEKLIGNLDLRYGVSDMRRILYFLQKALIYHDTHKKGRLTITLKSKQCLALQISGCFCRSGYVEKSGQCVKPRDCINNPLYGKYLERVIII